MGKIIRNGIEYSGTFDNATSVNYDNSVSGLKANTVQEGIDELTKGSKGAFPVDNLLSTATDLPLSANQGRVLDEKISTINESLGAFKNGSVTVDNNYVNAQYELSIEKYGKLCHLYGLVKFQNLTASTTINWGTITEEFLPKRAIHGVRSVANYMNANWNAPSNVGTYGYLITLTNSGVLQVNAGTNTLNQSVWIDMTWVCK